MKTLIEYDDNAINPRIECDNIGTMVCFHRRYGLGDKHSHANPEDAVVDIASKLNANYAEWVGYTRYPDDQQVEQGQALIDKHCVTLPLHLYDHSGITMSTSRFSCSWDSGQVGFIYMTHKTMRENWPETTHTHEQAVAAAEACLETEVKVYDQYLTGDVWCVSVVDDEGDVLDSCCGFFGYKYAEKDGARMLADCEAEAAERAEQEAEATLKEEAEYQYWAERDVITKPD